FRILRAIQNPLLILWHSLPRTKTRLLSFLFLAHFCPNHPSSHLVRACRSSAPRAFFARGLFLATMVANQIPQGNTLDDSSQRPHAAPARHRRPANRRTPPRRS